MTCASNSLSAALGRLPISVKVSSCLRVAGLAIAFSPIATPVLAAVVNVYTGTDTAGMGVQVSTIDTQQGPLIYYFSFGGNRRCNNVPIAGATLGGNTDGTQYYPVIDGRATFSELRPDFFIAADIRFLEKGKVTGSAVFKQAIYTGADFPPKDRDVSSCTTGKLNFTAVYSYSLSTLAIPFVAPVSAINK